MKTLPSDQAVSELLQAQGELDFIKLLLDDSKVTIFLETAEKERREAESKETQP